MDVYTFWKLVWFLPHYQGATSNMLQYMNYKKQEKPEPEPIPEPRPHISLAPVRNIDGSTTVPPEMLNATVGSNLISFARG